MSTLPSDCNAIERTAVRSCACARIETAVQTAIGIEAGNVVAVRAIDGGEPAPDEHLAIRLQRDRRNGTARYSCARIETAVQTAVGIEPGNAVAVRAVDGGERTADEHLAIRLQRDRRNTIRSCARIETAVQTPIGIEPGNPVAVRAFD